MTLRLFIRIAFLSLVSLSASPALHSEEFATSEKAKIEALITRLGGLTDATFIRNGSDYDSLTAAKFLRGKWQAHEKEIKTASDFIAKAATRSSTSGKPYLIRLKGAAAVPCADYLTAQLKELETGAQTR